MLQGSIDYSSSIDIWGVGCIFFEMVTGQALFPGNTSQKQLSLIQKCYRSSLALESTTTATSAKQVTLPNNIANRLANRLDGIGRNLLCHLLKVTRLLKRKLFQL